MESIRKRNSIIRNVNYTYDNTQRLIKNSVGSVKRFNDKNLAQKLKSLFIHKVKTYLWTGFFIFGAILAVNVLIMTFYLTDAGYNYNLMNNSYANAVLPEQDIGGVMDLGIVRVEEIRYSDLSIGDQVVIYEDFSLDVYWVETVVSLDDQTKNVELTYDNISTNTYHINELIGQFTEKADFLGTIYYTSTFTRGYIFLAMSHIILLVGYWYAFLNKKDVEASSLVTQDYGISQNVLNDLVQKTLLEETVPNTTGIGTLIPPIIGNYNEKAFETTTVIETVKEDKPTEIIRSKMDIIEYITADTGLNNYKGKLFLKYFSKVIAEELAKGEYVHIINFGKFSTVTMPAKAGVNPKSKKKIIVPEHKQARFKFYNEVKSKIE